MSLTATQNPGTPPPSDPLRNLAALIIHQAVKDLKLSQHRQSALQFFRSDWFTSLAYLIDLNPEVVRKEPNLT